MSFESDLILEDQQASPTTISEKYSDVEQYVLCSNFNEAQCQCCCDDDPYGTLENCDSPIFTEYEDEQFNEYYHPIQYTNEPCNDDQLVHEHCYQDNSITDRCQTDLHCQEHCKQNQHITEYCHTHSHEHCHQGQCVHGQCHQDECNSTNCDHDHNENPTGCGHHYQICHEHFHRHNPAYLPQWSTITISDDDIELICEPDNSKQGSDVFYLQPIVAQNIINEYLIQEPVSSNLQSRVKGLSKRKRFIARAVMIVSMVMIALSVLLVIISLIMSDHIDSLVRSSNKDVTTVMVSSKSGAYSTVNLTITNITTVNRTDTG